MFFGMQDLDFAHFNQFCPNLPNFAQISPAFIFAQILPKKFPRGAELTESKDTRTVV